MRRRSREGARNEAPAWTHDRTLVAIVAAGLMLRVAVLLLRGTHDWFAGGDGVFYTRQAWQFLHGTLPYPFRTVGPLYPWFLSACWALFPSAVDPVDPFSVPAGLMTLVRLVQIIVGTVTVVLCHALARELGASPRSARVAAAGVALTPAFVIEPFLLHTETFALALLVAAALLSVRAWRSGRAASGAAAGSVAALAGMTRLVLLPLPLMVAGGLLAGRGVRSGRRTAVAAFLAASVFYAPWLVWLHAGTGLWMPEGFTFNLLAGATGAGGAPDRATFDELVSRSEKSGGGYAGEASRTIAQGPMAWTAKRGRAFLLALAQPHGTADLGGPSLKAAVERVARSRSAAELATFARRPGTWVRVAAYVAHFAMLALALAGVRATWGRAEWLPVYACILYVFAVHALLVASSRYLFPAQPFLWLLAGQGVAIVTPGARR